MFRQQNTLTLLQRSLQKRLLRKGGIGTAGSNVVSLYQQTDSHVGSYDDYSVKICCSVNVCPEHFYWNAIEQRCLPGFQACLIRDIPTNTVSQTELCKDLWRTPVSQNDPYWRDAKTENSQDCFDINNERACCYYATYNDKEYGQYAPNSVIKKSISQL